MRDPSTLIGEEFEGVLNLEWVTGGVALGIEGVGLILYS